MSPATTASTAATTGNAAAGKTCQTCNSTYKISEVEPGTFLCPGFCRKTWLTKRNQRQQLEQQRKQRQNTVVGGEGNTDSSNSSVVTVVSKSANVSNVNKGRDDDIEEEEKTMEAAGFKAGDACTATFETDGVVYEGDLLNVDYDEGGNAYGTVRFVGYLNEQVCWVAELEPSAGPEARKAQEVAAGGGGGEGEAAAEGAEAAQESAAVEAAEPQAAAREAVAEAVATNGQETAPAPSAHVWKVGDRCVAVFSQDGVSYEGDLLTKETDPGSGRDYGVVRFVGYGNEETQWTDELKPSAGEDARKRQAEESGQPAEEEAEMTAQEQTQQPETQVQEEVAKAVEVKVAPAEVVAVAPDPVQAEIVPAAQVVPKVEEVPQRVVPNEVVGGSGGGDSVSSSSLSKKREEELTGQIKKLETENYKLGLQVKTLSDGNQELQRRLNSVSTSSNSANNNDDNDKEVEEMMTKNLEKYKEKLTRADLETARLSQENLKYSDDNAKLKERTASLARDLKTCVEKIEALKREATTTTSNNNINNRNNLNNRSAGSLNSDEAEEMNLVETPTKANLVQQQQQFMAAAMNGGANMMQPFMYPMMPAAAAAMATSASGDGPAVGQPAAMPMPMMFCAMPAMNMAAMFNPQQAPAAATTNNNNAAFASNGPSNPNPKMANPVGGGGGGGRAPLRRPAGDHFNPRAPAFTPSAAADNIA